MFIRRKDKKITFDTNDGMELKMLDPNYEEVRNEIIDDKIYNESQYIKAIERCVKKGKQKRNKIINDIISALRKNIPFEIDIDREDDSIINVKVIFDSDKKNSVFFQWEAKKKADKDFNNWLKLRGVGDRNNN